MPQIVKKVSDDIESLVKIKIKFKFFENIDIIKEIIIEKYDEELTSVVTDRNSKTNPNLYRDAFITNLNEFIFIEEDSNDISLILPNIENFNFSGQLKVLETILSGLAGIYLEISEEDYVKAFGKKPINEDPIDEYVPPADKIYLVRNTPAVRKAEKILGKKLVRYPFSNTPPIDIFGSAKKYVENNIEGWIEDSIKEAKKEISGKYKGAVV